jgi:hypothetical protein
MSYQNTQILDKEAKPTPIFFKTWMKLPNLDENIACKVFSIQAVNGCRNM